MALPRKSHRLKEKQVSEEDRPHVDLSPPPAPQRAMTGAERNKLYRERRKNNQERYSEYLEKKNGLSEIQGMHVRCPEKTLQ